MSKLFQFLTDLAVDPDKQDLFEQNPTTMMMAAGLSEAVVASLNSEDRAKISAAFADELPTDELVAVMGCICGIDPGPDPSPDPDPPSPPPSED